VAVVWGDEEGGDWVPRRHIKPVNKVVVPKAVEHLQAWRDRLVGVPPLQHACVAADGDEAAERGDENEGLVPRERNVRQGDAVREGERLAPQLEARAGLERENVPRIRGELGRLHGGGP
jgi:hypothetical protein